MDIDKLPQIFGERLRTIRHERNLTAQEVADRIGVHRSTYSGYESQNKLSQSDTLLKLSLELNTSTDYLLGLSDCPKPVRDYLNLKDYLNHGNLHWDGSPLRESDIQAVNSLFTLLINERKKNEQLSNEINLNSKYEMENSFQRIDEKEEEIKDKKQLVLTF